MHDLYAQHRDVALFHLNKLWMGKYLPIYLKQ